MNIKKRFIKWYIKKRFTKWYVKRGYTFGYNFSKCKTIGGDDIFPPMPLTPPGVVWGCPWWVKPFRILFSPSIYTAETLGKAAMEGFAAGLKAGEDMGLKIKK